MTTSPTLSPFSPTGTGAIPAWEFAYFQARNRSRVHDLVLNEFKKSGLTQAELARRMNKRPDVVCRLIGAPGNWGLDTLSDLLFAISHAEAGYSIVHPLEEPPRNYRHPDWLSSSSAGAVIYITGPNAAMLTTRGATGIAYSDLLGTPTSG